MLFGRLIVLDQEGIKGYKNVIEWRQRKTFQLRKRIEKAEIDWGLVQYCSAKFYFLQCYFRLLKSKGTFHNPNLCLSFYFCLYLNRNTNSDRGCAAFLFCSAHWNVPVFTCPKTNRTNVALYEVFLYCLQI